MSYTEQQVAAIGLTERVASVLSLIGCASVVSTFAFSARFRKPVNRLILYAVLGNVIYTVSTMIATNGLAQGSHSTLCQAQGFLIQMFLPADALWNLSMALNVYVTVFKHYDISQLRAREPCYNLINYGIPFVIALAYCFISTDSRGEVYGDAIIWCWISEDWDFLRIVTCYGPAWLCIIASLTIYVLAGIEIRKKRKQLQDIGTVHGSYQVHSRATPTPMKTTEIQVVSELTDLRNPLIHSPQDSHKPNNVRSSRVAQGNEYSVVVSGGYKESGNRCNIESAPPRARHQHSALEANKAAWRYTKCCLLFFASLLITWIPSSALRVFSLVWPSATPPFGLSFVAALVLPLTGFWNSIIYITTSWSACKALVREDIAPIIRGKPLYKTKASTLWTPPPPSKQASHRPRVTSPQRPYYRYGPSEDGGDDRARDSPSDSSLANFARTVRSSSR